MKWKKDNRLKITLSEFWYEYKKHIFVTHVYCIYAGQSKITNKKSMVGNYHVMILILVTTCYYLLHADWVQIKSTQGQSGGKVNNFP